MRGGIYADQRIGEILREMPTGHGNRFSSAQETLKADAIQDAGISRSQAYDLQKIASNPEVVQAVLDKAEQDGTIPSRKQVLDAINASKTKTGRHYPTRLREHMQLGPFSSNETRCARSHIKPASIPTLTHQRAIGPFVLILPHS